MRCQRAYRIRAARGMACTADRTGDQHEVAAERPVRIERR